MVVAAVRLWFFRYDCRLHLLSAEMLDRVSGTQTSGSENGNDCSAELLEEEMCDEERYRDMIEDIKRLEGKLIILSKHAQRRSKTPVAMHVDLQPLIL